MPPEVCTKTHHTSPKFAQQKRIIERNLFQIVIAPARAAVAGLHVRHQQQRVAYPS